VTRAALLLALLLLGAACASTDEPGDTGVVAGTVGFIGVPCLPPGQVPPCNGAYPGYVLRVYNAAASRMLAQDTTDVQGHYVVQLAPGRYAFVTPNGIHPEDVAVTPFTIVAGDTVTVDLVVDTGIR
jgi:hypothetical protein